MMSNINSAQWSGDQLRAADGGLEYQAMYPDIYYQLKPFVVEACDQMEGCGVTVPSRRMLDMMADGIERQLGMAAAAGAGVESGAGALRSRGVFRDLLDILLLQELFGRRRRYYW